MEFSSQVTWLLNSTTLLLLDQFQNEIGRRILKLQKNASGKVTRLCLVSQPYKRIGITQDSKILIAESGFKWPWKASILPNAKKAFLALVMRSTVQCSAMTCQPSAHRAVSVLEYSV